MHQHINTHLFIIPKINQERLNNYTLKFKKKGMKPPPTSSSTSTSNLLRKARLSPYLFTLLAFILFATLLYGQDIGCILGQLDLDIISPNQPLSIPSKFFFLLLNTYSRKRKKVFVHQKCLQQCKKNGGVFSMWFVFSGV